MSAIAYSPFFRSPTPCCEQLLVDVFLLPLERWAKELEAQREYDHDYSSDVDSSPDKWAPDFNLEGASYIHECICLYGICLQRTHRACRRGPPCVSFASARAVLCRSSTHQHIFSFFFSPRLVACIWPQMFRREHTDTDSSPEHPLCRCRVLQQVLWVAVSTSLLGDVFFSFTSTLPP